MSQSSPRQSLNRRQFLAASSAAAGAAALGASCLGAPEASSAQAGDVSFFLVSDTHFFAQKEAPTKLDEKSIATCRGLVDTLNRLPGTAIPAEAGGGTVAVPRGVIHGGDVIDTGDKNGGVHPQMIETEWAAFTSEFGLTGQDARLKYPIYEVHGNHDSPAGTGLAIQKITERNKTRPGLKNVSPNGLHYSWDWGPIHFINLGIVVGSDPLLKRSGRYNPLDSLGFLKSDLDKNVGANGRPVIITHHVDLARYSKPCDEAAPPSGGEWDSCDVLAYHRAIKSFNVVAILYGHTHTRNIFQWDGVSPKADSGIHVFNVDNGAHFSSSAQAFFYFQLTGTTLTVRELQTKDRWQTSFWTPQTWTQTVSLGTA